MFKTSCMILLFLTITSVNKVFFGTLSASETESLLVLGTRIEEKVYKNNKYGYTVTYPSSWFPSGVSYANAFEILNYDPENPQSVPERNRVSVIIADTVNENEAITKNYLGSILAEKNAFIQSRYSLFIDNHRAVRVHRKMRPQQQDAGQMVPEQESTRSSPPDTTPYVREVLPEDYAPGGKDAIPSEILKEHGIKPESSKETTHDALPEKSKSFPIISTYIANGKHLISIEAFVPKGADAFVIREILQIQESVKFYKVKNEQE